MTDIGNRNSGIDLLKFLGAVLIIFLHVRTPWHGYILPFTRCAVPIFFMISGFFIFNEDQSVMLKRIYRQIPKLIWIIIWATLFYSIFPLRECFLAGDFSSIFNHKRMLQWILLNDSPFGFHLWYLYAYLYVLVICLLMTKWNKFKYLFSAIPVLLLADLFLGKYSLALFNTCFPFIYSRNFLFVGLPYFLLGALLSDIQVLTRNEHFATNKAFIWGGVVVFTCTTYLEQYVLASKGLWLPTMRDHYFSTTFLAVSLFLLFLNINLKENFLSKSGKEDSLYIYILHPLFIIIVGLLAGKFALEDNAFLMNARPFLVLTGTLVFIYFFKIIRKSFKHVKYVSPFRIGKTSL